MADTNKKEYTSNLHPKGDLGTTVYPNVKSENIIDKDTTAYTAGKVPDSSLVSRSLDGLSEKIETNKIQTDTNKANIAKNTQDIATNAQNIENLSAVTPTDINVDANGYAVLEHDGTEITGQTKKVKFAQTDKTASFNEVTIPTASALKTKDGTSFGGGSKLYNGAEYLPTFDIATLKDVYLPLVGGKISGDLDVEEGLISQTYAGEKIMIARSLVQGESIDGASYYRGLFENTGCGYYLSSDSLYLYAAEYNNLFYFGYSGAILSTTKDKGIEFRVYKDSTSKNTVTHKLTINKTNVYVDDSPIITKATLVTHTVEIHYASNGSYFCFTGTSDKNTPIDSVQDLTTVFANRDLVGVGIFGSAGLSKIHVGSSVNDTTFKKYMNNGEYTNPSEETFATVFNPTGFTITDSVSAL